MSRIAEQLIETLSHPSLRALTRDSLPGRLLGMGYGVTCGRCSGSGRYSFNSIDGDLCYGCRGRREVAPRLSAKLRDRVIADVAAGKLEEYVAELKLRAAMQRRAKSAEKVLVKIELESKWREFHYGRKLALEDHFDDLSYAIHRYMDKVIEIARDLGYRMENYRLPPEERLAAASELADRLDEFAGRIRALDNLWARLHQEGSTNACRLAGLKAKATGDFETQERHRRTASDAAREMVAAEWGRLGFGEL